MLRIRSNNTNKEIKIVASLLFLVAVLVVPVLTFAEEKPIIPCTNDCGYNDLLQLVNNVINWIIIISVPVAAGVFAWAGFQMMLNANNPGKRDDSKTMMWSVVKGLAFILAAWILVTTITNTLLKEDFKKAVPVQGVK